METHSDYSAFYNPQPFAELDGAAMAWKNISVIAEAEMARIASIKSDTKKIMDRFDDLVEELKIAKAKGA